MDKEEYIAQCMAGTQKTREECEHEWNQTQKQTEIQHLDQETKEEYMANCLASGKTKEECEAAWTEAHGSADYQTLLQEREMLRVKLDKTTKLLREATKIIEAVNAERDAVTQARKYELATEISTATGDKAEDLQKRDLKELTIMAQTIDKARPPNFASVAKLLQEKDERKKPRLTVGQWDQDKKRWVGGN